MTLVLEKGKGLPLLEVCKRHNAHIINGINDTISSSGLTKGRMSLLLELKSNNLLIGPDFAKVAHCKP